MLAERALPRWASGRVVTSIGGQTERAVDDIGFVVDDGGWIMIQAKKNLTVAKSKAGALAEALEQLVAVDALGVPDRPPATAKIRPIDPDVDRVLVLTDHSAPNTINQFLAPATDRLRELPSTWPLADAHRNQDEERALTIVLDHLRRRWAVRHGTPQGEEDLRRLGSLLSVRALNLVDGGADLHAAQNQCRESRHTRVMQAESGRNLNARLSASASKGHSSTARAFSGVWNSPIFPCFLWPAFALT